MFSIGSVKSKREQSASSISQSLPLHDSEPGPKAAEDLLFAIKQSRDISISDKFRLSFVR